MPSPWVNVLPVSPTGAHVTGVSLGGRPSLTNELRANRRERRRGGGRGRKKPRNFTELIDSLDLPDEAKARLLEDKEDDFSITSPSDWFDAGGDLLGRALDIIDIPRAAVMATALEGAEVARQGLGKLGVDIEPAESTDRLRETGVSFEDWKQNFQNRVGGADLIEAAAPEGNAAVRTVGGLALDIGLDPLNYIGVGLADDPTKVARAFASEGATRALGKEGAQRAAQRVLQKGTTSLRPNELAAIGRRGGLYSKVPGTGVVGRTLGIDRALSAVTGSKIPRYTTISPRGQVLGDVASGAAQIARKPLNALLKGTAPLVEKGLSGSLPGLRAAVRRSDDAAEVVDKFWTVTKQAEARHVKGALESVLTKRGGDFLKAAKRQGVKMDDLTRAIGGNPAAAARVGPETVEVARTILREGKDLANQRVGREVIADAGEHYVPRVLTDEALQKFGLRRQAKGTIESVARGRKYKPGSPLKVGNESTQLVEPSADALGRSVEEQIEDFLTENGLPGWFESDFEKILPAYIGRLAKQTQTEYLANELTKLDIGRDIYGGVPSEAALRGAIQRPGEVLPQARKVRRDLRLGRLDELGVKPKRASRLVNDVSKLEKIAREARDTLHVLPRARVGKGWYEEVPLNNAVRALKSPPPQGFVRLFRGQLNDALTGQPSPQLVNVMGDAEVEFAQLRRETVGQWFTDNPVYAAGFARRGLDDLPADVAGDLVPDLMFVDVPADVVDARRASRLGEGYEEIAGGYEFAEGEFVLRAEDIGGAPVHRLPANVAEDFVRSETGEPWVFAYDLPDTWSGPKIAQRKGASRTFTAPATPAAAMKQWDEVFAKARKAEVSDALSRALDDGFKQFGANTTLPGDIVDELTAVGKMAEPGAFQKVIGIHDRLLKGWRQMALFSPGYHWRNSFGGVYMNWLGDVDEGRYLQLERLIANDPDAAPFFSKARLTRGARTPDDPLLQEGYQEAKRLGLFTGGQSVTDIEVGAAGPLAAFNPFRKSQRVAHALENRLRGAMFLDEYVKTGGNATEAFAKSQKYHFDYADLGRTERKIRQAVPFYTWTRRSIPLMLEQIVRNPSKINRYFRIKDNVESLSQEEGVVPQYFEDNWAIQLPWGGEDGKLYLMPDLPLMSLADATDMGQLAGQLSPFVKLPYEYNAQRQIWKGIPLTSEPEPIPATMAWLTPALKALGLTDTNTEGVTVAPQNTIYSIQQFLPQLGQARRLFPSEDRYEDRRMSSRLSYLLGIGLRTNTPNEQMNEIWSRYYDYQDQIRYYEQLGYDSDEATALAYGVDEAA